MAVIKEDRRSVYPLQVCADTHTQTYPQYPVQTRATFFLFLQSRPSLYNPSLKHTQPNPTANPQLCCPWVFSDPRSGKSPASPKEAAEMAPDPLC